MLAALRIPARRRAAREARRVRSESVRVILARPTGDMSQDELDVALRRAAHEGDMERIRELVGAGADLNRKVVLLGPEGHRTCSAPLVHAARQAKINAVRLLLDLGADPRVCMEDLAEVVKAGERGDLVPRGRRGRWDPVTDYTEVYATVRYLVDTAAENLWRRGVPLQALALSAARRAGVPTEKYLTPVAIRMTEIKAAQHLSEYPPRVLPGEIEAFEVPSALDYGVD